MSVHRENVIWQSADGTWSRGFYDFYDTKSFDDDDYDPEWDVEYVMDTFRWVACGYRSMDAAADAWDGANPGGFGVVEFNEENADRVAQLDDMAAKLFEERNRWSAKGTPKRRSIAFVQAERDKAVADWVRTRSGGYDNLMHPKVDRLDTQLAEMYKALSPQEKRAFDERDAAFRAACRKTLADAQENYRASNPYRYGYGYSNSFGVSDRNGKFGEVQVYLDARDQAAATRAATATPKPVTGAKPAAVGTARGKTTPRSTAGSFAPHHKAEADPAVLG